MTLLAIIIMAAAAASGDDGGIVAKGSLVVGSGVISSIVTWLAAKKHAEKTSVPQPCLTEQTGYQAAMKANEHDHENLFNRVAKLESRVEGISAKIDAKFEAITEQLRETKDMVRQLVERICKGKK